MGRQSLYHRKRYLMQRRYQRVPPRRTPIHQVDVVEQALEKMQKAGVIRPSDSPWSAPIVIVKKKDGTCRRLNEVTVKDAYLLYGLRITWIQLWVHPRHD